MATPYPSAEFEVLIYMLLGAFMALTAALATYIWKLRKLIEEDDEDNDEIRVDNIGLSHKAEETLRIVIDDSMLQSELPQEVNKSKATVSNAISELFDRDLIIKKKKANTYLIEPNIEEIKKQQR